MYVTKMKYCDFIIILWIKIFVDFVVEVMFKVQNLTCYIDMINGHAFMYPKLKPAFWLNPWKLSSVGIHKY